MLQKHFVLEEFQSPDDKKLITEIMNHDFAVKVFSWIKEHRIDEVYNSVYKTSFLQVNEKIAPWLIQAVKKACRIFDIQEIPEVYIFKDYDETISLGGISKPMLLISTRYFELLEKADPELMFAVIAGQVAGIVAGHHRGLILAWVLDSVLDVVNLPQYVIATFEGLINDWLRCRIYTCDRAMYLAVADYQLALEGMMSSTVPLDMLEKMNLGTENDSYKKQVDTFYEKSLLDGIIDFANSAISDLQWLPVRYRKLSEFAGMTEEASYGN